MCDSGVRRSVFIFYLVFFVVVLVILAAHGFFTFK